MVVNERFVERFIPKGVEPIGQAIAGNGRPTIVGVVRNVRQSVYERPMAETDFAISQIPPEQTANALSNMQLVMRSAVPARTIAHDLRRVLAGLDKTAPFRTPQTMDDVVSDALTFERLENWLFGSFAGLALVLALVGLYGLISHEVELGRHDIGIRVAIGASRGRIFAMVYRRVGLMLAIGLAAGIAGTVAARKLLATVVTIEPGRDALTLSLLAVALMAALFPARRAATVDPIASLRAE